MNAISSYIECRFYVQSIKEYYMTGRGGDRKIKS